MKDEFLKCPVEPQTLAAFWAFAGKNNLSPSVALRRVVAHVLTGAGHVVDDYDPAAERTNDYEQWARRRKAIDQRVSDPILKARVTPGMKAAFERYASARNKSIPAALAELVQHVIRSAGIDAAQLTPPVAPPLRSERVTVRLSLDEMRQAEGLAEGYGGVREWIVALVRSRTTAGEPQFSQAEQIALYESNRELWAIGRNVNQIAHALNSDLYQAGRLQGSLKRLPELEGLRAAIDAHTAKVMALCNAAASRWGQDE